MSDNISRANAINAFWEDSDIRTAEVRATLKALPSADAVSREDYEDIIKDYRNQYENMNNEIADLEAKLSAAAVHGEWEHWGSPFSDESEVIDTIVCSVCGARFIEPKDEPKGEYNYCPNCGAIMKGGAE